MLKHHTLSAFKQDLEQISGLRIKNKHTIINENESNLFAFKVFNMYNYIKFKGILWDS